MVGYLNLKIIKETYLKSKDSSRFCLSVYRVTKSEHQNRNEQTHQNTNKDYICKTGYHDFKKKS